MFFLGGFFGGFFGGVDFVEEFEFDDGLDGGGGGAFPDFGWLKILKNIKGRFCKEISFYI